MEKEISGRIVLKHDLEENWLKATTFIPKQGDIIIYDIDENYNYERLKIGNGTDIVSVLPFLDEDIASRILALETWSQEIEEKIGYIDYETKEDAQDKLTEAKAYTDSKTSGLASTSTVNTNISAHNTSDSAHNDIRNLIVGLTTRLNTLANSDDITLDQMSEIVAYIKNNKDIIDGITTSKVNIIDIINNLTTNVENKPLSAAQGVVIKSLIDTLQIELNEALADEVSARTVAISTAKNEAISTAASDATTKANDALETAKEYTTTQINNMVKVPAVSDSDNGKFLRVVSGVWAAVAIPNAEEASF